MVPSKWRSSKTRWSGTPFTPSKLAEAQGRDGDDRPLPFIVCLPAIDWGFRTQRPQQLLTRLARRGWRVLYAGLDLVPGGGQPSQESQEVAPGVRLVSLPSKRLTRIGAAPLDRDELKAMARGCAELRGRLHIREAVILCQSPLWEPLARALKTAYGWPIVYDRMDLHTGFSSAPPEMEKEEERLLEVSDLVTASARGLLPRELESGGDAVLLPNACEASHWTGASPASEALAWERPVIGYFGAISDWFDTKLLVELALARPGWSFVLIGATWGADVSRLERLPNVTLLGERPYDELPGLAAGFDVGLIPFRETPLTKVTNPVKLYEMLALGLKVVATRLPELESFPGEMVSLTSGRDGFLNAIEAALQETPDEDELERRRRFALENDWEVRADILDGALRRLFPLVSIGIVTYNHLELTQLCYESVRRFTAYPNYEIVFVDNASTDGTREWLEEMAAAEGDVRALLNEENRGFAAANNQAFAEASGEIFCLLNNDTVVTPGWLWEMVHVLRRNPGVGLVGPSTNGAANEAVVKPGYEDLSDLPGWALELTWKNDGESFSIPMLALYCAAIRREAWEEVGGLDEGFGIGMFEDDDLSRRLRRAGYDIRCLRSAYVHHFQQASFGDLDPETYAGIYEENRRRLREKWKTAGAGTGEGETEGTGEQKKETVENARVAYDSAALGNPMLEHFRQVLRYRDLLRLLIASNLTSRYKRSLLGVLWTLLNPLLTMIVMTIAFSTLFRFSLPHYPVYVLAGIVLWTFFQQTTMQSMNSLIFGSGLLKKVYIPAGVFPLSAIGTGVVNIFISLVPIVIIMVVLHHPFTWALLFVPVAVLLTSLFALGVGLTISTAAVFFSDVAEMYGVFLRIWFYLTPVMYPENILPPKFLWIVRLNPVYHLMRCWRDPMYDGVLPPTHSILVSLAWALGTLALGWWVFSKRSYEFALRA